MIGAGAAAWAGEESVDADTGEEQQDDAGGDEGDESAAVPGIGGCRAHAEQVHTRHPPQRSERAESWPLHRVFACGTEGVGEPDGAVGGGEEVLELLVG